MEVLCVVYAVNARGRSSFHPVCFSRRCSGRPFGWWRSRLERPDCVARSPSSATRRMPAWVGNSGPSISCAPALGPTPSGREGQGVHRLLRRVIVGQAVDRESRRRDARLEEATSEARAVQRTVPLLVVVGRVLFPVRDRVLDERSGEAAAARREGAPDLVQVGGRVRAPCARRPRGGRCCRRRRRRTAARSRTRSPRRGGCTGRS